MSESLKSAKRAKRANTGLPISSADSAAWTRDIHKSGAARDERHGAASVIAARLTPVPLITAPDAPPVTRATGTRSIHEVWRDATLATATPMTGAPMGHGGAHCTAGLVSALVWSSDVTLEHVIGDHGLSRTTAMRFGLAEMNARARFPQESTRASSPVARDESSASIELDTLEEFQEAYKALVIARTSRMAPVPTTDDEYSRVSVELIRSAGNEAGTRRAPLAARRAIKVAKRKRIVARYSLATSGKSHARDDMPHVAPSADSAAIWQAISARTGAESEYVSSLDKHTRVSLVKSSGMSPWIRHARAITKTYAIAAYGRPSDLETMVSAALDDIVQTAREQSFIRLRDVSTSDSVYPVYAITEGALCGAHCNHESCADVRESADALVIAGRAVRGWYVSRTVRCGTCKRCLAKRGACPDASLAWIWLPVARVIGGALHGAARRAFPSAKEQLSKPVIVSADGSQSVADEIGSMTGESASRIGVAGNAQAILAKIADACEEVGEPVAASVGASAYAMDMLAVTLGFTPTERGRRSARAAILRMT